MTREEAIRHIKAWNLDADDMEVLSEVIPELKEEESDDERIRKFLTDYFEIIKSTLNDDGIWKGFQIEKILAYLAKQKESIEKEYVFRPLAGTDITTAANQAVRRANEGDHLVLAFNGAYIPVRKGCNTSKIVDIYDAFIKKQNKDVEKLCSNEWSEEDERIRKDLIKYLESDRDCQPCQDVSFYDECIAWLEKQSKEDEHKEPSFFTHHHIDESLQDAVTHQMEDDGDVDDFVRRGIDSIALKYAVIGAEWQKGQKPDFIIAPKRIRPRFAVGDTVCRPMWSDHTIREIYIDCDNPVYICVNEEGTESHISFSEQDEWERKEQKPINNSTREKIISRATSEKQVVLISESSGEAEIGWDTRSLEDAKRLLEYGLAFINKNITDTTENQKATETPQWMIDFLNDILSSCIIYDDYVRRQEYQSKVLGIIKWLENQKAKTPQWMIDFLKEMRPYSINKEEYEDYGGRIEFESKILTIIKWLEGNFIQQKEQTVYKNSKSEIDFADKYSHDVWEKLMSKFNSIEGYSIGCNDVSNIVLNAVLNAFKWKKEQKASINIDQLKSMMLQYLQEAANEKDDSDIEADTDKRARMILRYDFEQKPAEWSEEDEKILLSIIYDFKKGAVSTIWQEQWLNSLPERFNLQPKNEWSDDYREEDIQTRFAFYTYKDDPSTLYLYNVFVEEASRNHGFGTKILSAAEKVAETIGATTIRLKVKQDSPANNWYRKNGYGYVSFEGEYDWLEKNLEYMKPSNREWSGKDERMLNVAIKSCEQTLEDYPNDKVRFKDCITWLKSLPLNLKKKNEDVDKLCSNEWSEEDKHRCKDAIYFLETAKKHYASTSEIELTIEWLKSLQSQTKQEQTTFL